MHELGIISEVMKVVKNACVENDLTTVEEVILDVGDICLASPDYLKECFKAVVYKTEFSETKLTINIVEAFADCRECGEIFDIRPNDGICPNCKTVRNYEILSGTELEIREIKAY